MRLLRSAVVGMAFLSALGASAQPGADAYRAIGKVTKVDAPAGRVTIAHEAIPAIKWPAMTMTFSVREKALLETVRPGQKVDFTLTKSGNEYVLTELK